MGQLPKRSVPQSGCDHHQMWPGCWTAFLAYKNLCVATLLQLSSSPWLPYLSYSKDGLWSDYLDFPHGRPHTFLTEDSLSKTGMVSETEFINKSGLPASASAFKLHVCRLDVCMYVGQAKSFNKQSPNGRFFTSTTTTDITIPNYPTGI